MEWLLLLFAWSSSNSRILEVNEVAADRDRPRYAVLYEFLPIFLVLRVLYSIAAESLEQLTGSEARASAFPHSTRI
jgi:hypothetical protein